MDALDPHIDSARKARDSNYSSMPSIIFGMDEAQERGRRLAVNMLKQNLQQRKLLEDTYGKQYCHIRYPEVYRNEG